jgi:ArsR family transcriptional regulator
MNGLNATSEVLQLLGEPSRLRLLRLLQTHELTVGELVAVTGLTQSRVSTHLGKLKDGGFVVDRRVGTSAFYRLADRIEPTRARLWGLLSRELSDAQLALDQQRAAECVAAREGGGRWVDEVAGSMERHYSPGRTWEATCRAFATLLSLGDVLDVGSGDGAIAELLAPRARSVTCIDVSPRVVAAAESRLSTTDNVRCLQGDVQALPLPDAAFDRALMLNVLTYCERPARALSEVARVLRAGAGLILVTLAEHEHMEVAATYGHLRPGFAPSALKDMLLEAGLTVERCEVTSRESRRPRFEVLTAVAHKS